MNYIDQLNGFWKKVEAEDKMKPSAIAVYMALLQINNRCGWKDSFKVDYNQVLNMTGLNKNTYYTAISFLNLGSYIEYIPGPNQYQSATFKVVLLYEKLGKHRESTGKAQGKHDVLHRESTGNIPKQVNNKTINLKNNVDVVEKITAENFEKFVDEENEKLDLHLAGRDDEIKKEKSSAEKEKEWPLWSEMLPGIKLCSYYDNAKRLLADPLDDIRESEFEWFWEQKRDEYIIRKMMPAMTEIAQHFYYWLDKKTTSNRNKTLTKNGFANKNTAIVKNLNPSVDDKWKNGFGSLK